MVSDYSAEDRVSYFVKYWGDERLLSELGDGVGGYLEGEDGMRACLGIPSTTQKPTLTPSEIKTAYIKTARKTHPDTGKTPNPNHFNQATQAYKTLTRHHTSHSTPHHISLTPRQITTGGTYTIKLPTGTTTITVTPQQTHGIHHTSHGTITHTTQLPKKQQWSTPNTITHQLTLTFLEAAVGTQKTLPILTKRIKLTIPPGTTHGTQFTATHPDYPNITIRATVKIKIPKITQEQATQIQDILKK